MLTVKRISVLIFVTLIIFAVGCGGGSSGEADENADDDKIPSSVPTGFAASVISSTVDVIAPS